MEITEVRIKLMEDAGERLQAFCSITFDHCFVIRDLKIIEGTSGAFVAMPSRKLTAHCPQCGCKNHLRACHCNQCGLRLKDDRVPKDDDGRAKLYADIAHPINSSCREMIQDRVIKAYQEELVRSKQPGYVSSYDDFDEDLVATPHTNTRRHAPSHEAKVEPAEQGPRAPHIAPAAHKQRSAASASAPMQKPADNKPKRGDGFGAGIF